MKQKETNLAEYKSGLTPLQEQVATFLASGKQITDTANELQISRATIYRLFDNVVFMAYYNLLCYEIKINTKNNLFTLQDKAFKAIGAALESDNDLTKLKAATWIIEKIQDVQIGCKNPIDALSNQCVGKNIIDVCFDNTEFEKLKRQYDL